MRKLVLLFAALLVAGCGEKSLSDSAIEKALDKAVELEALQERNDLYYQVNKTKPYSGWAKVLYDSGQAEQLFAIKDGKREGRTLAWEDDGTKTLEVTYKDGALEGYFEVSERYSGPKEGFPDVDELIYDSYGARVAGTIRQGKMHGKWVMSLAEGQKYAELKYKNGKLDGTYTIWHDNGQKEEKGNYENGELDGRFTMWHENGQKAEEGTMKDGKMNGLWTTWHENGQKQVEGTYKADKKDGLHTTWYENGQKKAEATYKDGELVSGKFWNSKGEEVETEEEAAK